MRVFAVAFGALTAAAAIGGLAVSAYAVGMGRLNERDSRLTVRTCWWCQGDGIAATAYDDDPDPDWCAICRGSGAVLVELELVGAEQPRRLRNLAKRR